MDVSPSRRSASTYLHEEWVGLIADGVRVVKLAVVPHDLPQWRVLLGHSKHPWRVAALCQQLPVWKGRGEIMSMNRKLTAQATCNMH